MYFVYVIQSEKDGSTYIGFTGNINKRLKEHNQGKTRSIKSKVPFKMVYFEEFESKTEARKREILLKKNSFAKEQLFNKIFEKS